MKIVYEYFLVYLMLSLADLGIQYTPKVSYHLPFYFVDEFLSIIQGFIICCPQKTSMT